MIKRRLTVRLHSISVFFYGMMVLNVWLLSACNSKNITPKNSNIFQAGINLSTGEYKHQLQRKRLDLNESKQNLSSKEQEKIRLEYQIDTEIKQLDTLQEQVTWLKQENREIETIILQQQVKTVEQGQKKKGMLDQLKKIRKEIQSLEKSGKSKQNEAYKKRLYILTKEVRALRILAGQQ